MSQQEGWPLHPLSEEECREYAQLIGLDASNFVVKYEPFHISYNNEPDSVFDVGQGFWWFICISDLGEELQGSV